MCDQILTSEIKDAVSKIVSELDSIEYQNKKCHTEKMDIDNFRLSVLSEKIALLKLMVELGIYTSCIQ